jgi:dolichol-phosphate mannosyltransferase
MADPPYSVVVPVFDEREILPELYRRLRAVLDALPGAAELVFVDDGSRDGSLDVLRRLNGEDPRVRVVALSRNFGHQKALTAGLLHSRGRVVAVLDADLQDPPELLPRLIAEVEGGADVAYGVRTRRKEGPLKRALYFAFYRLIRRLSDTELPLDAGDFCAMSRRLVDLVNALPERDRYLRGLRSWMGFRQAGIPYERAGREAGETKYTYAKLVQLSVDGLISFTLFPLRLIILLGLALSLVSFLGIVVVLYFRLFTDRSIPGFASVAIMLLSIGGIQLLTLGVIGEYVGRVFQQVKGRPLFVVAERIGFEPGEER